MGSAPSSAECATCIIIVYILYNINGRPRETKLQKYQETASLDAIFVQIWIDLAQGAARAAHPFHTPALASLAADGPDLRTVVLRYAELEARQLLCHTDYRSPKVRELREQCNAAWLFYHPMNKIQLRIRGTVTVHHDDELARARWKKATRRSRQCYRTQLAPGTATDAPGIGEPLAAGFQNFAVIDCTVHSIDWLYLHSQGHLRARFDWQDGQWRSGWVAP